MAFGSGNIMTASDILDLKARVKSEMARRRYNGSVESYAGPAYDYTYPPARGEPIRAEHGQKIIEPVNAVKSQGIAGVSTGSVIQNLNNYNMFVNAIATRSIGDSVSDCGSGCTGLCSTTCIGECRTGCGTACQMACSSGCTGDCRGSCSGGCTGYCRANCADDCSSGCSGDCEGGCVNCYGCTDACHRYGSN